MFNPGTFAGYQEAAFEDQQQKLALERQKRENLAGMFQKLSEDESLRPEVRNEYQQRVATIYQTPFDKKLPKQIETVVTEVPTGIPEGRLPAQQLPAGQRPAELPQFPGLELPGATIPGPAGPTTMPPRFTPEEIRAEEMKTLRQQLGVQGQAAYDLESMLKGLEPPRIPELVSGAMGGEAAYALQDPDTGALIDPYTREPLPGFQPGTALQTGAGTGMAGQVPGSSVKSMFPRDMFGNPVKDDEYYTVRLDSRGKPMAVAPVRVSAGGDSETAMALAGMAPEWRNVVERVSMPLPSTRRRSTMNFLNQLYKEGDFDELGQVVAQIAVEEELADTQRQVLNRRSVVRALDDMREQLRELRLLGVDTGLLTGTMEDIARRLGRSTDPRLVSISTRIQQTMIQYRRAATGVQFSQREAAQYDQMFPNIKWREEVNMAAIDGLMRGMAAEDMDFWVGKVGVDGARLIGVIPEGLPAAAAVPVPAMPGAGPNLPAQAPTGRVEVVSPTGQRFTVPVEQLDAAIEQGYTRAQ